VHLPKALEQEQLTQLTSSDQSHEMMAMDPMDREPRDNRSESPPPRSLVQTFADQFFPAVTKSPTDDLKKLYKTENKLVEATRELRDLKNKLHSSDYSFRKLHSEANQQAHKLHDIQIQNACFQTEKQLLKEENDHLRKDNGQLRTYIVDMESGKGPLHDEEYYIQGFEELRGAIESWIAKHSKANSGQALSEQAQVEVSGILAKLGDQGALSSKFLNAERHDIRSLYGNRRSCIALIRHVVALFLFTEVFEPFAFGLPQSFSDELKWMKRDIFSRGISHDYRTNIRTIYQYTHDSPSNRSGDTQLRKRGRGIKSP
jgi:hypothetical protein